MRAVLILSAGIVVGYTLNNRKDQSIDFLVRNMSRNVSDVGLKIRNFFSTSATNN